VLNIVLFSYAISLQTLPPSCWKVLARGVPKTCLCRHGLREPQPCFAPYETPPRLATCRRALLAGLCQSLSFGCCFTFGCALTWAVSSRALVPTSPAGPAGAYPGWLEPASYKIQLVVRPRGSSVTATLLKSEHGSPAFRMNQATASERAGGKGTLLPGHLGGTRLLPCLSQVITVTSRLLEKS